MTENEMIVQQTDDKTKTLVESGYFPDIKSVAQAKVKIWIGKTLGLNEYQSLTGIYITPKGQIGLMASVMSSLIKMNPKYDYTVDKIISTECVISFFKIVGEKKELLGVSTFDEKDAAKCGLANKDTYKSYPRNLLFARALSNGARFFCPETICGYHEVTELEDLSEWEHNEPQKSIIELTSEGATNGTSA